MKNQPGTLNNYKNREPWKTNLEPWKNNNNDLEPWKTIKPTWNHEQL